MTLIGLPSRIGSEERVKSLYQYASLRRTLRLVPESHPRSARLISNALFAKKVLPSMCPAAASLSSLIVLGGLERTLTVHGSFGGVPAMGAYLEGGVTCRLRIGHLKIESSFYQRDSSDSES